MPNTPPLSSQLATLNEQLPYLVRALRVLGTRSDYQDDAEELALDLSGITAMVAAKFTNNRTAEGILEALRLTVGCVSLSLSYAHLQDDGEAAIDFLLLHGAERVFQQGYRLVKELAELPDVAIVTAYDKSPQEQERRLKATFTRYCDAEPNDFWLGHQQYQREWEVRTKIQTTLDCAKWLRKHHADGAIRGADMDADGVIAIALIFATQGGKIVAKAGQKDLEDLLAKLRKNKPDMEQSWNDFLRAVPAQFHALLIERLDHLRGSNIINMLHTLTSKTKPGKATMAVLFQELQNHGGNEIEVDYS